MLNDEKKTAYDAALQAGFDSKQQPPTQSNESTPIAETPTDPLMPPQLGRAAKGPAPITDIPTVGQTGKHAQASSKGRKKKTPGIVFILPAGVIVVFIIFGAILFSSSQAQKKEKKRRAEIAQKEATEKERKTRVAAERKREKAEQKRLKDQQRAKEAAQKTKEEKARKAEEQAARKAEEEAAQKAGEQAARKAEEEATRKAEEEAAQKAREQAARKAKEKAALKAEEEAARKAEEAKFNAQTTENLNAARVILKTQNLIFTGGFWEPKIQWEKYRQKLVELKQLQAGAKNNYPIPKRQYAKPLNKLRSEHNKKIQLEFNRLANELWNEERKAIVFYGDAKDKRFWELYPYQNTPMPNQPRASDADRQAHFYRTAYAFPQYRKYFINPTPSVIDTAFKQTRKLQKMLAQQNKKLLNTPEIEQALKDLDQTLRPAPSAIQ